MLGWGLSSRPNFDLAVSGGDQAENQYDHVKAAEQFFVESLEAWRAQNKIEKMILAGHSMGGYMSVAYCEKYPERVEKLILLSPVGVPEEDTNTLDRRKSMQQASWRFWALSGMAQNVFQYHSAGKMLRGMPEKWGMNLWTGYVDKRLPAIEDPEEQVAISEYLYANNTLPGSGEHCVNKVLNPFAYAFQPTEFRIPSLHVKKVAFLYGQYDWMDARGGTVVQL
jgi:cardiolipin-specific phospholipase